MKNVLPKLALLCITLTISSCSERSEDINEDLTNLVMLRQKKEDQLSHLREELSQQSETKGEIQSKIGDIERQSNNEKSTLIREFTTTVDKPLNENLSELRRNSDHEMQLALEAFRHDPKTREWSSRMDKKEEFAELNRKYTAPVAQKFQDQKDELISNAKKAVADYKTKTEEQVTEKYADSLKSLSLEILAIEEKHEKKELEYSAISKEVGELAREIGKKKELKEIQQK